MVKQTYNPHSVRRKRTHGYLRRKKSRGGKNVLSRRRQKGRWRLSV